MTLAAEILDGLKAPRKTIPPKYLYDARGSALFEEICLLPEYYLTRTEQEILQAHLPSIAGALGENPALFEFGSGASVKTRLLLSSVRGRGTYVPIELSRECLLREARRLALEYPGLKIVPLCADFTKLAQLPNALLEDGLAGDHSSRVLFFPGSTIGNFERAEALALLRRIPSLLGGGSQLIVGVDLVKDPKTLEAAYNDSRGVTAAFNLNLLRRLNEECPADFDLGAFEHRAIFDPGESRIEMHLVSLREQAVRIGEHSIRLRRGETIHTESSYKYDDPSFRELLRLAGFSFVERWTDPRNLFAVYHAASKPSEASFARVVP